MRPTPSATARWSRALLAAFPFLALTIAIPLANRIEPRIVGLPFLLAWILGWVLATPAILWTIGRLERRW